MQRYAFPKILLTITVIKLFKKLETRSFNVTAKCNAENLVYFEMIRKRFKSEHTGSPFSQLQSNFGGEIFIHSFKTDILFA